MKKLFFTAITLIAFSSVSMANTIADEEVSLSTNIKSLNLVQTCMEEAIERVNVYEDTYGCLSATQYTWYLNSYYNACMNKRSISAN